jgi:lysozyme family protein
MSQKFSRRHFLSRSALASASLIAAGALPAAAWAQSRRGPLGLPLPPELRALIPDGALGLVSTIETLVALEREADVRRLPASVLQLLNGDLPRDPDALYAAALPRLVALIDRAGGARRSDGGIGDRAGALLARLHGSEHRVPDALSLNGADAGMTGELALPDIDAGTIDFPTSAPDIAPPAQPDIPAAAPRRSTRYPELAEEYTAYFASASLREERRATAEWHLAQMRRARSRYEAVERRTGVPWFFIGATHGLEASFNFRGHLHNGDFPLSARTRQVPANRPTVWLPPSDWESSAIDALRLMGFAGQTDWSLARTLYRFEAYNGFGYRRIGVPTPYLWSFSSHYERGKFVADGRWSATARSQQCGAAVMLKLLVDAGDISFA